MRRAILAFAALVGIDARAQVLPPLPQPVSNAAVATGIVDGERWVFAVLGIDSSRRWSGITRRATGWRSSTGAWRALPDVPGDVGRLAATAQVVRERLFVFGGYTVDSAGRERSVPAVDIFEPRSSTWLRGAEMPVAVDDAVSVVYRDSLVYVISGWHDTANVQLVQVYDAVRDAWFAGTPIPGPGVFGHSGGLAGNTIVFIDGAVKQDSAVKYRLLSQVWLGTIDAREPTRISWRVGPAHAGPPLYRAAVARCGTRVVFAGGTDNPYNYDGMGYDGRPAQPSPRLFAFDTRQGAWQTLPPMTVPSMDHRGLIVLGETAWTIGGMHTGRQVSAATVPTLLQRCSR
ncbi:MAG: galactose oxidase [Gemmatimonadota bacterium]